jgi:N-hydroxyarylamine O-acetyltransferase
MTRVNQPELFDRYLEILGVEPEPPSLPALTRLVQAQLTTVPFENISKLFLRRREGAETIPTFERYLDGIERFHLGGTCYPINGYFNLLLRYLDYDAKLCGADISSPDVHMVSMVKFAHREFMVDVGYAAPFFEPLPRDLPTEHVVSWGDERYVLEPRDGAGRSQLHHEHRGRRIHGYQAKPHPRSLAYFERVMRDSYGDTATFMNAVALVRFWPGRSVRIHNLELVEATPDTAHVSVLADRDELVDAVREHFQIPGAIVRGALEGLGTLRDVHDIH